MNINFTHFLVTDCMSVRVPSWLFPGVARQLVFHSGPDESFGRIYPERFNNAAYDDEDMCDGEQMNDYVTSLTRSGARRTKVKQRRHSNRRQKTLQATKLLKTPHSQLLKEHSFDHSSPLHSSPRIPTSCLSLAVRSKRRAQQRRASSSSTAAIESMKVPLDRLARYAGEHAVTFHVHPYVADKNSTYVMFWGPSAADIAAAAREFAHRRWKKHIVFDGLGAWVIEATAALPKPVPVNAIREHVDSSLGTNYTRLSHKKRDDLENKAYANAEASLYTFQSTHELYGIQITHTPWNKPLHI